MSFQEVNRIFVLSFKDTDGRRSSKSYCLPLAAIKNYNVVIYWRNFLDQPVNNNLIIYDNIRKIATGQVDDYTTACLLLNSDYFDNYYKMITIDSSKQQPLDADPKALQQISFTANLDWQKNTTRLFIIEEAKETILNFS